MRNPYDFGSIIKAFKLKPVMVYYYVSRFKVSVLTFYNKKFKSYFIFIIREKLVVVFRKASPIS
jgi:hypothetical protein